jgi:hypothetical protein
MLWDSDKNRWIYSNPSGSNYDGGMIMSGPRNTTGLGNEQGTLLNYVMKGQGGDHITSSQIVDDGTTVQISGSLIVTGSITGSITNATSASYSLSASFAISSSRAVTSSFSISGSNTITSSFAFSSSVAVSSSFTTTSSFAQTSSFAATASSVNTLNQPVTISGSLGIAGTAGNTIFSSNADTLIFSGSAQFTGSFGITGSLNVTQGITGSLLGNASTATSASFASTASFAQTASYIATAQTASFVSTASFATSASLAQTASFVANAQTASLATTAITALTASTADSFAVRNNTTLGTDNTNTVVFYSSLDSDIVPLEAGARNLGSATNYFSSIYTTNLYGTASYALTASYVSGSGAGVGFPFSGSAVITGSLLVTNLSGSGIRYVTADANGLLVAQTASAAITSTQTTIATAGQTIYPISGGYTTGLVNVFVNGTKLNSTEYTDTSGTNIVLATGSFVNDVVEFQKYFPASGVTNNALRQVNYFTATTGQTVFSASYTPGLLDVFYNGSKLDNTEYTANSGNAITLATASAAGDKIEIDVYSYQVGSFSGIGGSASGSQIAYFGTSNSITGSANFVVTGSAIIITGSLTVSGSGTFTNIGPAVFSGSLTSTQGFTGSFSGVATTASFAQTASSIANLNQNVQVTGSMTVSSTITAQTLNVQQVTSSIVYSSGSNVFGNSLSNTQQMTGSLLVTGSVSITGSAAFSSDVILPYSKALAFNSITNQYISADSSKLYLGTANLSRLTIDTSGNVGIGTTSPPRPLTVISYLDDGAMSSGGNLYSNAYFGTGGIMIGTQSTTGNGVIMMNTNRDTIFGNWNGSTNTERMRILSTGNVAIGTTSTPNYTNYRILQLAGVGTTGSGLLYMTNSDNSIVGMAMAEGSASRVTFGSQTNHPVTFVSNDTERMRITSSGNVGIGTSSPASNLDVYGTPYGSLINQRIMDTRSYAADYGGGIGFGGKFDSSEGITEFGIIRGQKNNSTDGDYGGYLSFLTRPNGGSWGEKMRITSDGIIKTPYTYSNTTAAAANVQIDSNGYLARSTSSLKYKNSVENYDKGLNIVNQLRPVYYKGNNDGDTIFAGLIAEDIHDLGLTEFVQYAEDGSPDALAYQNMIALAFKAIQELSAEIEILKNK